MSKTFASPRYADVLTACRILAPDTKGRVSLANRPHRSCGCRHARGPSSALFEPGVCLQSCVEWLYAGQLRCR